jgi:hypothetical protein
MLSSLRPTLRAKESLSHHSVWGTEWDPIQTDSTLGELKDCVVFHGQKL